MDPSPDHAHSSARLIHRGGRCAVEGRRERFPNPQGQVETCSGVQGHEAQRRACVRVCKRFGGVLSTQGPPTRLGAVGGRCGRFLCVCKSLCPRVLPRWYGPGGGTGGQRTVRLAVIDKSGCPRSSYLRGNQSSVLSPAGIGATSVIGRPSAVCGRCRITTPRCRVSPTGSRTVSSVPSGFLGRYG